jgi:steroid delta-isomerase-like uncharacterized protein
MSTALSTHSTSYQAVIRLLIEEVWNKGNWHPLADQYYAEDIIVHSPRQPEPMRGREAFEELHATLHAAFPDIHFELQDIVGEGGRLACRWIVSGTHEGEYFGFPATGRKMTTEEGIFYRFEDGLLREIWLMPNVIGTMSQLGLLPSGPPPKLLLWLLKLKQRRNMKKEA